MSDLPAHVRDMNEELNRLKSEVVNNHIVQRLDRLERLLAQIESNQRRYSFTNAIAGESRHRGVFPRVA